jgi:hypothetical protein
VVLHTILQRNALKNFIVVKKVERQSSIVLKKVVGSHSVERGDNKVVRKRSKKEQRAIHAKKRKGKKQKSLKDVDRQFAQGKSPVGGQGGIQDGSGKSPLGEGGGILSENTVVRKEKGFNFV